MNMTSCKTVFIKATLAVMSFGLLFPEPGLSDVNDRSVPQKVVIFYSSIGFGHISAAKAIEQNIKNRDPRASVILKNIRDFTPKSRERIDEKLFWFVVKNFPDTFDSMFRGAMEKGNTVKSLADLSSIYNTNQLYRYIVNTAPTAMISTHYGATQEIIKIREKFGKLRNIPVAWMHTDYFKGYFPRISKNIEQTFLGMPALRDMWIREGVQPDRVVSTGMPINPALFEPIDRDAFMKDKQLNPSVKTIVLASGGEGVGDFPLIVKQIANTIDTPIQIIAVCAKNEKHFARLTKMIESGDLPDHVKLMIHKQIPNNELLNYIKASDLYITKSGGLSPTEGFAITKPMILLDVYGGHERDNAQLFEKEGFAIVNRDQKSIGDDVRRVLFDKALQNSMIERQLGFRNSFNLDAITDFAFNAKETLPKVFRLGVENGDPVMDAAKSIAALERVRPADIELLLSYGKSPDGEYFRRNGNPFGHIAIRIGDKVYTANGRSVLGQDARLIHETSLVEYLYGVDRPTQNVEHTDAYGSAYGRDVISLRVQGVSEDSMRKMLVEVERIEAEWRAGTYRWTPAKSNCADITVRILRAGGFDVPGLRKAGVAPHTKGRYVTMPLDVFENYRAHFERLLTQRTEIVMYTSVPGTEAPFVSNRFPLSIHQIKRSLKNWLLNRVDPLETKIGKRISTYPNEPRTYLENINGKSAVEEQIAQRQFLDRQIRTFSDLKQAETELDEARAKAQAERMTSENLYEEMKSALSSLSPEEIQDFADGKIDRVTSPERKEELSRLLLKIQKWDSVNSEIQSKMDGIIQMEQDFFIKSTQFAIADLHDRIRSRSTVRNKKQLEEIYQKAQTQFDKFIASRHEYGGPKDGPTRIQAFRTFFQNAKFYLDIVNGPSLRDTAPVKNFWANLKTRSHRQYTILKTIVSLTPHIFTFVLNTYIRPITGPGEAPVTQSLSSLTRALSEKLGISVDVKGRENLPDVRALDASKTVYIVTPTHRDPIMDAVILSHLNLDKAMVVMATSQIVGRGRFQKALDKVDNIIAAGSKTQQSPVEQILEQLQRQKTNSIVIYPEGSVSIGLHETRPIRARFTEGLVTELMNAGYNVKLVPVTYENSSRTPMDPGLMSLLENAHQFKTKLNVKVSAPIDSKMIRLLDKTGGSDLVNKFLRSIWMENLPTNSERIYGLVRPQAAESLLSKLLGSWMPSLQMRSKSEPAPQKLLRCQDLFSSP